VSEVRADLRRRIAGRWPTAEDFYRERDDRTARLVGEIAMYAERPVEIHVDPLAAHDVTVQRIALIAANLTARWARSVRVVVPNDASIHESLRRADFATLAGRIDWEMAHADPFASSAARANPLCLFVGPWNGTREIVTADDFCVHASHWTALGRRGPDAPAPARGAAVSQATVAAAALAASLGAADLFKRAIGHERESWISTFAWDTWSHDLILGPASWDSVVRRPVSVRIDLGRTLLAGVGAIGSALVYMLDMMPLRGAITLFDRDQVDATNLNRSPLFTVLDAFDRASKTAVSKGYFEGRDLLSEACDGIWREHAQRFSAESFDVWISLTNEDGAWAEVPFHLPPVVLHGTTTSGWGFGAGRHIPRVEDCTLCRMPRPEAKFRGPCAIGEIAHAVNDNPVVASLPFLSTASAALVLANFLKLAASTGTELGSNDVAADLTVGLPAVIGVHRTPTLECRGCRFLRSRSWETMGGRGKFASLSEHFSLR
jgi:hypothetical protein